MLPTIHVSASCVSLVPMVARSYSVGVTDDCGASMWVLGTKPGSPAGARGALTTEPSL